MRLFYDLGIESFVLAPGNRTAVAALTFKRGNSSAVQLSFCQDGLIVELATGATGEFMLKPAGDFGGEDPVVSAGSWTKSGTGPTTIYTFNPSFNNTQLNESLVTGTVTGYVADAAARYALAGIPLGTIYGQVDNGSYWKVADITHLLDAAGWVHAPQIPSLPLIGEFAWVIVGAAGSGPVLAVTIANDVIKGDEGVPTSAIPSYPSPAQIPMLRLDITAKIGGAAADLDGIPTALINLTTFPLLYLVKTGASGGIQGWQLMAGTDAEDEPSGIVRPADYAGGTNEKVWKLVF